MKPVNLLDPPGTAGSTMAAVSVWDQTAMDTEARTHYANSVILKEYWLLGKQIQSSTESTTKKRIRKIGEVSFEMQNL